MKSRVDKTEGSGLSCKRHLKYLKTLRKVNRSIFGILPMFIIFVLQSFLVQISDAKSCDILFPKEDGLTIAETINQGSELKNLLSGKYGIV